MTQNDYQRTIDLYGDDIGRVQYIQHYGSDKMIVNAARVSFGKDNELPLDERDSKLIKYLMKNKHTSPLEHCGVTFKFVVPLFVRGQHHRHRTWAYNEISRRYTDENVQFYNPTTFRTQHEKNRQASNLDETDPVLYVSKSMFTSDQHDVRASNALKRHVEESVRLYELMLNAGVAREQARMVLPQNMYTEYYGTVNLNNLLKFVILRDDAHAQLEIQVVGKAVRDIATDLFPTAMNAFNELRGEIMT